jgi:hypothetical protein
MHFAATRRHSALFVLVLASLVAPTAAIAGTGGGNALTGGCPDGQLSQPFLPWLDGDSYRLVGDGGFEAGATGWTLSGGAQAVAGNEPWTVHSSADTHSLYLPAGGQATSPATCIGLLDPTVRFFARSLGGTVRVDATLHAGLLTLNLPIGVATAGNGWAPTLPMPLLANLTTLLSGNTGSVTLSFTAIGGSAQIDDVYVDPFKVN